FFFSSRRRHTRLQGDWSSDVCSSDLAQLPPREHVDLAILGMALPDSRVRLPGALEHLEPRYILPSHQDNFFRPLDAGFQFGPLTDFPRVRHDCEQANRGRLILLDYFRPWTLPKK